MRGNPQEKGESLKKGFCHFLAEEEGAASVEYAVLASAIAAVIVLTVTQMGIKVVNLYQKVVDSWP